MVLELGPRHVQNCYLEQYRLQLDKAEVIRGNKKQIQFSVILMCNIVFRIKDMIYTVPSNDVFVLPLAPMVLLVSSPSSNEATLWT